MEAFRLTSPFVNASEAPHAYSAGYVGTCLLAHCLWAHPVPSTHLSDSDMSLYNGCGKFTCYYIFSQFSDVKSDTANIISDYSKIVNIFLRGKAINKQKQNPDNKKTECSFLNTRDGAADWGRTSTVLPTRPSTVRVCQFRHSRILPTKIIYHNVGSQSRLNCFILTKDLFLFQNGFGIFALPVLAASVDIVEHRCCNAVEICGFVAAVCSVQKCIVRETVV